MKGIILAGGTGSRLWPITLSVSKQLLPVYDKPMIYYPLSVLMLAGIREILVITTPDDRPAFASLLGNGRRFGVSIEYAEQPHPDGIAEACLIGAEFTEGEAFALILGDNLFFGHGLPEHLHAARRRVEGEGGAVIFAHRVADPERYGVVTFDETGRALTILEKPERPPSPFAVTGLYFYDGEAAAMAGRLTPSARGELEITDLNRAYRDQEALHVRQLGRGFAWLDTGTPDSLLEAAEFVATLERRQGIRISSPEEIAWRQGWIGDDELLATARALGTGGYARYLASLPSL